MKRNDPLKPGGFDGYHICATLMLYCSECGATLKVNRPLNLMSGPVMRFIVYPCSCGKRGGVQ